MATLTHLSTFSGIGGFDLGFGRAGVRTVGVVEFDPYPQAVLRRHFPNAHLWKDIRDVTASSVIDVLGRTPDVVSGGFPCQDVSVAGRRAGLAGERSGLWFEFHRLLAELKPGWVVVENVPGLLSSNGGRDFAVILRGLVELGYGVCWRVLDSQYAGVAQRRRRVFIVGHLGDGRAAHVLFERESGAWDSPPSREAGERPAAIAARRAQAGSNGWGVRAEATGTLDSTGGDAVAYRMPDVAGTLAASGAGTNRPAGQGNELDFCIPVAQAIDVRNSRSNGEVSGTLQAKKSGGYSLNYVNPIAVQHAVVGRKPTAGPQGKGWRDDGVSWTLDSRAAADVVAFAYAVSENQRAELRLTPYARQLTAGGGKPGQGYPAVCYGLSTFTTPKFARELSPTVTQPSPTGGGQPLSVAGAYGVRRLTPTECERLQAFPDGHTAWGIDEHGERQEMSDGRRYKMLGNAVTVSVAEWIGRRLVKADADD